METLLSLQRQYEDRYHDIKSKNALLNYSII